MHSLIYLASQSPRRSQLFTQIGVAHALLLPGPQEDAAALELALPGEVPVDYVQTRHPLELEAAGQRHAQRGLPPGARSVCADTTVALEGVIFGNPTTGPMPAQMLAQLSGQSHQVFTAVACGIGAGRWAALSISQVELPRSLPHKSAPMWPVVSPWAKPGRTAFKGAAAAFIAHIEGSYSGIMGLPLFETAQLLRSAGVLD